LHDALQSYLGRILGKGGHSVAATVPSEIFPAALERQRWVWQNTK